MIGLTFVALSATIMSNILKIIYIYIYMYEEEAK